MAVSTKNTPPKFSGKVRTGNAPISSTSVKVNNKYPTEVLRRAGKHVIRQASHTKRQTDAQIDNAFAEGSPDTYREITDDVKDKANQKSQTVREAGRDAVEYAYRKHKREKLENDGYRNTEGKFEHSTAENDVYRKVGESYQRAEAQTEAARKETVKKVRQDAARRAEEAARKKAAEETSRASAAHGASSTVTVVSSKSTADTTVVVGSKSAANATLAAGAETTKDASLFAGANGAAVAGETSGAVAGATSTAAGSTAAGSTATGSAAAGTTAAGTTTAAGSSASGAAAAGGGAAAAGIIIIAVVVLVLLFVVFLIMFSIGSTGSQINFAASAPDLNSTEQYVMTQLLREEFEPVQIAAIMGNMWGESKFVPDAIEANGEGYGLLQWSYSRKENLLAYAEGIESSYYANGVPDISTQMEFFIKRDYVSEWSASNRRTFESEDDPASACHYFMQYFVRPENPTVHRPDREDAAVKYYLAMVGAEREDRGVVIHYLPSIEPMTEEKWQFIDNIRRGYIGKPYVLGASGPNSYDCSGFVSSVLIRAGLLGARMDCGGLIYQVECFTEPEFAERGDLVFWVHTGDYSSWHGAGKRPFDVGHVALYLGDGWIQDSLPNKGNTVRALNVRKILCFGRVINHGTRTVSLDEISDVPTNQITAVILPQYEYKRKESWA